MGYGVRAVYRVSQVWRRLSAHVQPEDQAFIATLLPAPACALFATMTIGDQRHCLNVCATLQAQGCVDRDLLAAALLHDVGKGDGRVRFWMRPTIVLLRALAPCLLRWLASSPASRWRRPFYVAWHHAAIGADLAAAVGVSERVVLFIRTHHDPQGPAAALHAVDDQS
jgi:putative nucleotidyltransferase with HDIG domain